jgi:hypothetical protein
MTSTVPGAKLSKQLTKQDKSYILDISGPDTETNSVFNAVIQGRRRRVSYHGINAPFQAHFFLHGGMRHGKQSRYNSDNR